MPKASCFPVVDFGTGDSTVQLEQALQARPVYSIDASIPRHQVNLPARPARPGGSLRSVEAMQEFQQQALVFSAQVFDAETSLLFGLTRSLLGHKHYVKNDF